MLGKIMKNKQAQKGLWIGAALGVVAGAFLPDKYNPVEMVKGLINKG